MSKSFIEDFKRDFKFLEDYGFVFAVDPYNPNRPCYMNNYGEIFYWVQTSSGTGWDTEVYYQINGSKYNLDVKEEYKKIFRKSPLFKSKVKVFKELFEFLINSTGKFYNLRINKDVSQNLRNHEVTDLSNFTYNEGLFKNRDKARILTFLIIFSLIIFAFQGLGYVILDEHVKSYEVFNTFRYIILGSICISQLVILFTSYRSFHAFTKIAMILYAPAPLLLSLFLDRRLEYKIHFLIVMILLINLIIHLILNKIKKDSYYLLNGVLPFLYPFFVSIVKTFILRGDLFFNDDRLAMYVIIGLIIGIVAALVYLIVPKKDLDKKEYIGGLLGSFFISFFLVFSVPYLTEQNINYSFDNSEGITYQFKIIDKNVRRTRGKYTHNVYNLYIIKDGITETISVDKRVYYDYSVGDEIEITKFNGFLNYEYYEYVDE